MNYNNMMKNWKNFVNESYSPPTLQEEEAIAEMAMPSTIAKLKNLRPRDIKDYPFPNLFGDMLRRVVFMEVKPDGTIFDIQEFFKDNGWEPKWGEGIITKEIQTLKGPKTVAIPIMKAMIKVKNAVMGRDEKPEKFWKENNEAWRQYEVSGTHSLKDDAPKKARNLHAEWLKIKKNGREGFDRLEHGPTIWMQRVKQDTSGGKDIWKGVDFRKQPVEVEIPRPALASYIDENIRKVFQDKYPGMDVKLLNRANEFGGYDLWIRITLPDGGEFPHLNRFHLNRPAGGRHQNLIESWIKYLNTPLPGVKKSGPALDYYTRNPEVLEAMDLKPVIISRDVIDIGRMSDFEEDGIESCHSEGGMYDFCALREADKAGLVTWLFEPEDMNEFLFPNDPDTSLSERSLDEINEALQEWDNEEIMYDPKRDVEGMVPQARGRLRRYINNNENYDLALPDPTIYGDRYPGFNKAVRDWALEEQEGYLPENYGDMSGEEADEFMTSFVYTGGTYHSDARSGEMLNDFLGKRYYASSQMVPYESMGKDEQDRKYQVEGGAEQLEEDAQEVEDSADLTHGGIWFEVDDYEHPPSLSFSGDFVWKFPSRDDEVRADKELPLWSSDGGDYQDLTEGIREIMYDQNFYYDNIDVSEGGGTDMFITVSMENDEARDIDGFRSFASWMKELDDEPWEKARKQLKLVLRKLGYLEASEDLDQSALAELKNLKHFAEYKPTGNKPTKNKDFSFELKHLLPIGKGYNMPEVLARTYWASKQGSAPDDYREDQHSNLDYHRAYRDLQNGYDTSSPPEVTWHALAKDLFYFVAREVLGDVGVEGEEQLELPLQEKEEITARTAQARAAEEETFAAATLEHLGKHLENFIVRVQASEGDYEDKKGWEEFGRRVMKIDSPSYAMVKKGIQHTVPIDMDIEFDIDEEDSPKEVGLGIQILLWMDNNLEEVQQHAGYLLQKYNGVYLESVDARLATQNQTSNKIEDVAAELSIAAEAMLKDWKEVAWDLEEIKEEILGVVNLFKMRKKNLMELYYDWSGDEAMTGSLLTTFKTAKYTLKLWKDTKEQRKEIINVARTLEKGDPNFYRRVVLDYGSTFPNTANLDYSVEQARETVLEKLSFLYRLYAQGTLYLNPETPMGARYKKWVTTAQAIDYTKPPFPEGTDEEVFEAVRRMLRKVR